MLNSDIIKENSYLFSSKFQFSISKNLRRIIGKALPFKKLDKLASMHIFSTE